MSNDEVSTEQRQALSINDMCDVPDIKSESHSSNSSSPVSAKPIWSSLWLQTANLAAEFGHSSLTFHCLHQCLKEDPQNIDALVKLTDCCLMFESCDEVFMPITSLYNHPILPSWPAQGPLFSNSLDTINKIRHVLELKTNESASTAILLLSLAKLRYIINDCKASLAILEDITSMYDKEGSQWTEVVVFKCLNHLKLRQFSEIKTILHHATEPLITIFQRFLVKYHFFCKQYLVAAQILDAIIQVPKAAFTSFNYKYHVLVLLNQNQLPDALYESNQSIMFFPTNYELLLINAYIHVGINSNHSLSLLHHILQYFSQSRHDFLPTFLQSWNCLQRGDYRESFDHLQHCFAKSSKIPLVWLVVGTLYLYLDQLPESLSAFSQTLRLQSDEKSLISALAWDGLSCVYERCTGQMADAIDAAGRAMEIFVSLEMSQHSKVLSDYIQQMAGNKQSSPPDIRRSPFGFPESLVLEYLNMELMDRMMFSEEFHRRQDDILQSQASSRSRIPEPPPQISRIHTPAQEGRTSPIIITHPNTSLLNYQHLHPQAMPYAYSQNIRPLPQSATQSTPQSIPHLLAPPPPASHLHPASSSAFPAFPHQHPGYGPPAGTFYRHPQQQYGYYYG